MTLWRDILRVVGLSNDARVHISAPGIEVVLTGDPDQVRTLLGIVKTELERSARQQHGRHRPPSAQVVHPTELDEMDSPYALPEARVMPVGDSQITDEKILRNDTRSEDQSGPLQSDDIDEAATLLPDQQTQDALLNMRPKVGVADSDDRPKPEVVGTKLESDPPPSTRPQPSMSTPDEEDAPEVTAVAKSPSAIESGEKVLPEQATVEVHSPPKGTNVAPNSSPFVTDGGPTLMPSDSQSEIHKLDTKDEYVEVADSDVQKL